MEARAQTRKCVACGRDIQWDANVCPYCGHDYRQQMAGQPPMMPMMPMAPMHKPHTVIPVVAGGLLVVSAVIWIIEAILMIVTVDYATSWLPIVGDFVNSIVTVFAIVGIILAVIGLFGGLFAVMRKHAGLAIIGSIFCLFAIGPYAIASILALVSLILLAVSHGEFEK